MWVELWQMQSCNLFNLHFTSPLEARKSWIPKYMYLFFYLCLVIFFDFLQSNWLQQRAAFYDILTLVQRCYFLANGKSEKLSFEDKNYRKIWNFTQWILNNPIWLHVESVSCLKCIFIRAKCSKSKYFLDINIEKQCNFCILSSNASHIFSDISKNIRSNLQIFSHTTLPGTWKV